MTFFEELALHFRALGDLKRGQVDLQDQMPASTGKGGALVTDFADYPPGWDITRSINACEIAKAFHDTYERLAPTFTYKTRPESAVPWADVPQVNKQLMIATVVALIESGEIREPR